MQMFTDDPFGKAIEDADKEFDNNPENFPVIVDPRARKPKVYTSGITLIDADSILFKVCCTQTTNSGIRKHIKEELSYIDRKCMYDRVQIALKGKGNFRYNVFPDYKSNRPNLDEDLRKRLNYAHEWVLDNYPAVTADGMEADDLVSIWAWEALNKEMPYIVAHIDKDLDQIPGEHFNFNKKIKYTVSAMDGYKKLIEQWITGDSADGIPGIKGYGPAKAKKAINGVLPENLEDCVRRLYKSLGYDQEYCQQMYDCVYMLQSWDELYVHEPSLKPETDISEQDVLSDETEDSGLQELSE